VAAALLALVAVPAAERLAHAQSAAPPAAIESAVAVAPGTEMVEPSYPALAPENVPAFTGNGALAVVPAGPEGAVAAVSVDFGDGFQATAVVPADSANSLTVMLSAVELTENRVVISVEVFSTTTGAPVSTPITAGLRTPAGIDLAAFEVVYFDAASGTYQTLSTTQNPATGNLEFEIP
jgi:hypothetical protein